MFEIEIGEFPDTDAGLEKDFNYGRGAFVAAAGVAKGPVFGFGKDAGRFVFVFGVFDLVSRVALNMALGLEEAEKTFDGVDFAGDGFGGVVFFGEMILELVEVFRFN